MEIETWFLADYNLFKRINSKATPEFIKEKLNIDLIKTDPESYNHPATIINLIYQLFDIKYKKGEKQTFKIVDNIDFAFLVSDEIIEKLRSWKYFIDCIDNSIQY